MAEKQVRSKKRVTEHGEVFTAEREVKAMCDLVADECLRVDSRFLEPACGDGNFLAEILSRKLNAIARKYKKSSYDYERQALLALGSIYGVELLQDNVMACRVRLFNIWNKQYETTVKKKERNNEVLESVKYILQRNIICGNALTLHEVNEFGEDTGVPIIFSQWAFVKGPFMKREDYTFEEVIRQNDPSQMEMKDVQVSFIEGVDEDPKNDEGTLIKVYEPLDFRRLKEYG